MIEIPQVCIQISWQISYTISTYVWHVLEVLTSSLMIILRFGAFHIHQTSLEYDLLYKCPCELHLHCFQGVLLHVRYITILNIVLLYHLCIKRCFRLQPTSVGVWMMVESPPSADVGWSMSYGRFSPSGGSINYISHHYPLCDDGWQSVRWLM